MVSFHRGSDRVRALEKRRSPQAIAVVFVGTLFEVAQHAFQCHGHDGVGDPSLLVRKRCVMEGQKGAERYGCPCGLGVPARERTRTLRRARGVWRPALRFSQSTEEPEELPLHIFYFVIRSGVLIGVAAAAA